MDNTPAADLSALQAAVDAAEQAYAEADHALDDAQAKCEASELEKLRAGQIWSQRFDELATAKLALNAAFSSWP